jgi:hypothetical protein
MFVLMAEMDIEFNPGDERFLTAFAVEMIIIDRQFAQLVLELMEVDPEIDHGPEKHVAADPAEQIEIKSDAHRGGWLTLSGDCRFVCF